MREIIDSEEAKVKGWQFIQMGKVLVPIFRISATQIYSRAAEVIPVCKQKSAGDEELSKLKQKFVVG